MNNEVIEKSQIAREASLKLACLSNETKNKALTAMAEALDENSSKILIANGSDVIDSEKMLDEGEITQALIDRLKVDEVKIKKMAQGVMSVMALEDPAGKTIFARELDDGLTLYKVTAPIGVVGVVFESRPDVVVQVASLCLKSGNALILKGGSEARNSNRALYNILYKASLTVAGIPEGWMQLLESREEIKELLGCDEYVDLMIPRGSNSFVKYVKENTKIPVLGHSDGICHVFVDGDADLDKALKIAFDSKVQYPAVCNAVETLLVDQELADEFLPKIIEKYREADVEIRGDKSVMKVDSYVREASEEDWSTEYNDLIISIKVVFGLNDAIDHINTYGSGHTDSIITEDEQAAKRFLSEVDSSSVFWNASTRFSDGFRYGFGAEIGISTNKIHARGPVGLEGMTIYKYILKGEGHIVADYAGKGLKTFKHEDIDEKWE